MDTVTVSNHSTRRTNSLHDTAAKTTNNAEKTDETMTIQLIRKRAEEEAVSLTVDERGTNMAREINNNGTDPRWQRT